MDNTLSPLSPVLQSGSTTPVDRINARLLAEAASAATVASADTQAANDVIELSPAARLLSAASATQNLGSNPQGFSSVLGAAINFASAFNSFNSLSGIGASNNALPGFSTGSTDLGDIFSLPGTLGGLGTSGIGGTSSSTDILLQSLTNTPLNTAASAGTGNGATLLTGLANIGITLQGSTQLPGDTSASLVVDPLKLQSAFNANPTATSAVLAQAASSFAPLAASLVRQSNNFFLTQQDLSSSSDFTDIFTSQLQLQLQLAAVRLQQPTAVTTANAALQKTLQDEALSDAIVSAQNAALAEAQATAATKAAAASATSAAAATAASPAVATAVPATTQPAASDSTASTTSQQQDASDAAVTVAASQALAAQAEAASSDVAAVTGTTPSNAIRTPLSANGGPDAATANNTNTTAAATVTPPATPATVATAATASTPATTTAAATTPASAVPSAQTQAQDIAIQNALNNAAAAQLLTQQNAIADLQQADADAQQQADQNSTSAQTANTTATAATSTAAAAAAATAAATVLAQPAVDASTDTTLLTRLEQANADALAATAAPAAPAATTTTTDTTAASANPETSPVLDPALAAAIAAYSLRSPVSNAIDDRNSRELGNDVVDAVNSVESVSAIQPVTLDVHDAVAAAQRNELLRNDTPRP
ncbi:hypothetical protein [Undibacterium sp.]|uniref:hypothetical protein n=1 Tax=Undibacterium sp. TaxID=1914977 RepID=UPI00374C9E37